MSSRFVGLGCLVICAFSAAAEPMIVVAEGKTPCRFATDQGIPIAFKNSVFDFALNNGAKKPSDSKSEGPKLNYSQPYRLAALPGGLLVRSFESEKKGGSLKPVLLDIWWKNDQWCIGRPPFLEARDESCRAKLSGVQKIRNETGETIAIVVPEREGLRVKQAKKPFRKDSYEVDVEVPEISLQYLNGKTKVAAKNRLGSLNGEYTVTGEPDAASMSRVAENKFMFKESANFGCLEIPKGALIAEKVELRESRPGPSGETPAVR